MFEENSSLVGYFIELLVDKGIVLVFQDLVKLLLIHSMFDCFH